MNKSLKAFDIIKSTMHLSVEERKNSSGEISYWLFMNLEGRPKEAGWRISKENYDLLKKTLK